jgi:UbiD family decarboxylase
MPLDNLREFLEAIDKKDALVRIDRAVSIDREITEIADR